MTPFQIFLSLILVVRNQAGDLKALLTGINDFVSGLVSDYELVIVDNASEDESLGILKELTGETGLPNLQVYALTKEVDWDTACWVGFENALGDFVAIFNPQLDDINFLPTILDQAVHGVEVVFAKNEREPARSITHRVCLLLFHTFYKWFTGIHLAKEAPNYRVLSRRVINFILQHSMPSVTYRHLPATGGFSKANLTYSASPKVARKSPLRLMENIDRGMRLLVSTTRGPMRLVTSLSLFGAVSNLMYSIYVISVAIWKADVAPGWVTLSLQQSGMFFLISLVLLVLGEYILHMASLSNEGPRYHVAQEFTSAVMTRRQKLNVQEGHAETHPTSIPTSPERVA